MNEKDEKYLVQYNIGDNEIKLTPNIVKEYLTTGAEISRAEFKLFAELCKVHKLNPFMKEVYFIKYGTAPAQIVVGKDTILKRAIKNPDFDGREQGVIVKRQEEPYEKLGAFVDEGETLVGGWARVYRKSWSHPTYIRVSLKEVAQRKSNGELNSNWAQKAATMVEKVALVRALRESFTDDLGGLYESEELPEQEEVPRKPVEAAVIEQPDPFEDAEEAEVIDLGEL